MRFLKSKPNLARASEPSGIDPVALNADIESKFPHLEEFSRMRNNGGYRPKPLAPGKKIILPPADPNGSDVALGGQLQAAPIRPDEQRPDPMVFPVPAGHKSFNLKVGDIVQLRNGTTIMITAYFSQNDLFATMCAAGWLTWTPSGNARNYTPTRHMRGAKLESFDIVSILGRTWQ